MHAVARTGGAFSRRVSGRAGRTSDDREEGVESPDSAEENCADSYCTLMVNVMVWLSPGPVSTIEA
jgi:hypothetical protein